MGYVDRRGRLYDEPFIGFVRSVFEAPAYHSLGPWACKLLLDIGGQYNGSNNGDLSIPFSRMSKCGWNSRTTLWRALKELVAAGLVHVTRQGRKPKICHLLALTWLPLNTSRKFDDDAIATFEPKGYRKNMPLPAPNIRQKRDWTIPNGGMPCEKNSSSSPREKQGDAKS